MKLHYLFAAPVVALAIPALASAAVFSDSFDDATSASRWNVVQSSSDSGAVFGFDYSGVLDYAGNSIGVPRAGQTTRTGLQLHANRLGGTNTEGINVYAKDVTFTGRVIMEFDMYYRFPSGTGSTQYQNFGVHHSTQTGTWNSNGVPATSGIWFTTNGDGSSTTRDYRGYEAGSEDTTGVGNYLGGSQNNTNAGWTALFPDLDGAETLNLAGAAGNRWVNHRITYDATTGEIKWELKKASDSEYTVGYSRTDTTITQTSGTVTLGLTDPFTSGTPDGVYVIYDNLTVVPEPAALGLISLGALGLLRRSRRV